MWCLGWYKTVFLGIWVVLVIFLSRGGLFRVLLNLDVLILISACPSVGCVWVSSKIWWFVLVLVILGLCW